MLGVTEVDDGRLTDRHDDCPSPGRGLGCLSRRHKPGLERV